MPMWKEPWGLEMCKGLCAATRRLDPWNSSGHSKCDFMCACGQHTCACRLACICARPRVHMQLCMHRAGVCVVYLHVYCAQRYARVCVHVLHIDLYEVCRCE